MKSPLVVALLFAGSGVAALAADRSDVLIADFESDTYGEWQVEGQAFGAGPADGTLPGQMTVSGFEGQRLVNSYLVGDGPTGRLTSPPFVVDRDYLAFLIGGGGFAETTCVNLLRDGTVVRTATGPNTRPGGSEALEPSAWDVRDLQGKTVQLQVVDQATGGWGHINLDQVVLTDEEPTILLLGPREVTFSVQEPYLVFPIKNGAAKTELVLEVAGEPVRRYGTELAVRPDDVDWYAYFTLEAYRGQSARVTANRASEEGFALIRQAETVPGSDDWYVHPLRHQLRFSQAVGWNNDPNGMVYLDGIWHLFFQHNPVGWTWGNMTWGHAVSEDLVHWRQLPNKLFPKISTVGDCFSGGATVDRFNTAGWKTGDQDVLVAFLTDTGAGEALAYSTDNGQSFTWYEGNPVVKHRGRDPKVIWYPYGPADEPLNERAGELGGHWVMAVYDDEEAVGRNISFYTSVDLKAWARQSHVTGYYECPELFPLAIDGNPEQTRWVLFAADAQYALGDFDGRIFTPRHEGKHRVHWGAYYASQTFDNAPDNRRIQIGWIRAATPGAPFNQTFSVPHELSLRTTEDGVRMFAEPVPEFETLRRKKHVAEQQPLTEESPVRLPVSGELFDVVATFELGDAGAVGLDIGGNRIVYDASAHRLRDADLSPVDGRVSVRVLVDRVVMETIGNDGRVYITSERSRRGPVEAITAFAEGGGARLSRLEVYELESIWGSDSTP